MPSGKFNMGNLSLAINFKFVVQLVFTYNLKLSHVYKGSKFDDELKTG